MGVPPALMDRTDGGRGALGVTYGRDPRVHHRVSRMDRADPLFHPSPEGVQNMVDPRGSSMAIELILVFFASSLKKPSKLRRASGWGDWAMWPGARQEGGDW